MDGFALYELMVVAFSAWKEGGGDCHGLPLSQKPKLCGSMGAGDML
jgi:hypothetical protein